MILTFAKKLFNEAKELATTQILIVFILFIQVGIVTRQLGVESFGRVSLLIVITSFVFRIFNSRNSDVILIVITKNKENVFTYSILFDLFIGIIGYLICIILIISPLNFNFGNFYLSNVIHLFLISRIIQGFSETAKAYFTYNNNFKMIAYSEFLSILIRFLFIITIFIKNPSIENYLIAQSLFSISYGLISLFTSFTYNLKTNMSFSGFNNFLKVIKGNYFKQRGDQIVGLIPQHFDMILLGYFSDFSTVGLYRVAKRAIDPINYIVNALTPIVQNRISNKKNFDAAKFVKLFLIPLSISLILFYFLLGKQFLLFVFGEDFELAYIQLLILLVGNLIYLNTFWIRHILLLKEMINFHTISRFINTLFFLFFSFIFSTLFPIYAISLGASIGVLIQKIYEFYIYKSKIN